MIIRFVISIVGPAIGGAIAATTGFLLADRRRRQDGKDRFLAVVSEWEAELHGCKHIDDRVQNVHASSLNPLHTAVFAVIPFISKVRFDRLLRLWQQYKDEKIDAMTAVTTRAAHELKYGKDSPDIPQYPDDKLRSYFQKFRNEVG
jgi:hypothetical protein